MPYWMLRCPNCARNFVHSKIELAAIEEAHRDPFRVVQRPVFAQMTEKHTCPGCNRESVFQRLHLFYRDQTSDFDF
jgi:ribosomal protein L37AE/L43A